MTPLYPDIEPFASHNIEMETLINGTQHSVYVEQCGNPDGIPLLTIHAAKNFNFKYVILIGCNQNIFPPERVLFESKYFNKKSYFQEINLFYTALSKAEKEIFICYVADNKTKFHQDSPFLPSEFLYYIEKLYKQD